MRVVIDTNVLVPTTWREDTGLGPILNAWKARNFELVLSEELLGEVEEVLRLPRIRRRNAWNNEQISDFVATLREDGTVVNPSLRLNVVRDEDDNRVLEAGVEGHVDFIVTLDQDLLTLGEHGGIRIVTPGRFLAVLTEQI